MTRVRISTTVDADRLEQARRLLPGTDSQLIEQALTALIDQRLGEHELAVLALHPYDEDPDLIWHAPPGPSLAYDGPVPDEVIELARARRQQRGRRHP